MEAHRAAAEEHGIQLKVTSPLLDGEVMVHRKRVALVFFANPITNAIRHTSNNGEVWVRTRPADDSICFEVIDTGPGIPKEYQPRLFDKFFRVPGVPGGGAGLGLSIAKRLCKGMAEILG